jgi:cobalt-zinc-cadmium efflux system outer membrane protein
MDQIEISNQLKNAVTTKVQVGEASELELMRADIRLSEAKNDLSDAERMFHKSRYELFNIIGLDPEDQKYEIRFVDSLKYFDVSIDQEEAVTRLEQQPQYRSITNSLDASNNQIDEAWSSFLPDLSFSYYKQNYGSGYNFYGYQVGLKVPLWFVFNQNGDIQTAKASKRELEWKQKEIYLNMKKEIEKAWHSYKSSELTIKRFMNVIQVKANDLLSKTLEGYQVGEINFLSLIDAQQTFLGSRKRYLSALHDYYLQLINLEKYMNNEIVFK